MSKPNYQRQSDNLRAIGLALIDRKNKLFRSIKYLQADAKHLGEPTLTLRVSQTDIRCDKAILYCDSRWNGDSNQLKMKYEIDIKHKHPYCVNATSLWWHIGHLADPNIIDTICKAAEGGRALTEVYDGYQLRSKDDLDHLHEYAKQQAEGTRLCISAEARDNLDDKITITKCQPRDLLAVDTTSKIMVSYCGYKFDAAWYLNDALDNFNGDVSFLVACQTALLKAGKKKITICERELAKVSKWNQKAWLSLPAHKRYKPELTTRYFHDDLS